MEEWQEKVEEIYKEFINRGLPKEEAQRISLNYMEGQEERKILKEKLTLRIFISYSKLRKILGTDKNVWEALEVDSRKTLFWQLGFDTRNFEVLYDIGSFVEDERRHYGEFLFGNERLDNDWLTKKVDGGYIASLDARLKNDTSGIKGEISRLSGGNLWDSTVNSLKKQ